MRSTVSSAGAASTRVISERPRLLASDIVSMRIDSTGRLQTTPERFTSRAVRLPWQSMALEFARSNVGHVVRVMKGYTAVMATPKVALEKDFRLGVMEAGCLVAGDVTDEVIVPVPRPWELVACLVKDADVTGSGQLFMLAPPGFEGIKRPLRTPAGLLAHMVDMDGKTVGIGWMPLATMKAILQRDPTELSQHRHWGITPLPQGFPDIIAVSRPHLRHRSGVVLCTHSDNTVSCFWFDATSHGFYVSRTEPFTRQDLRIPIGISGDAFLAYTPGDAPRLYAHRVAAVAGRSTVHARYISLRD